MQVFSSYLLAGVPWFLGSVPERLPWFLGRTLGASGLWWRLFPSDGAGMPR